MIVFNHTVSWIIAIVKGHGRHIEMKKINGLLVVNGSHIPAVIMCSDDMLNFSLEFMNHIQKAVLVFLQPLNLDFFVEMDSKRHVHSDSKSTISRLELVIRPFQNLFGSFNIEFVFLFEVIGVHTEKTLIAFLDVVGTPLHKGITDFFGELWLSMGQNVPELGVVFFLLFRTSNLVVIK